MAFLVSQCFASLPSSGWVLASAGGSSPAEDGAACEGPGAAGTAKLPRGFPDIPWAKPRKTRKIPYPAAVSIP